MSGFEIDRQFCCLPFDNADVPNLQDHRRAVRVFGDRQSADVQADVDRTGPVHFPAVGGERHCRDRELPKQLASGPLECAVVVVHEADSARPTQQRARWHHP